MRIFALPLILIAAFAGCSQKPDSGLYSLLEANSLTQVRQTLSNLGWVKFAQSNGTAAIYAGHYRGMDMDFLLTLLPGGKFCGFVTIPTNSADFNREQINPIMQASRKIRKRKDYLCSYIGNNMVSFVFVSNRVSILADYQVR